MIYRLNYILILIGFHCFSQKLIVNGIVLDNENVPVVGANIIEKNSTTNGTISDFDGKFSITTAIGSTLEVSYIGLKNELITIKNDKFLEIRLVENLNTLEEVTIVAYGQQKKV